MLHILEHSVLDSIKILPFIFLMYLIIEYFEHKNNTGLSHLLMKSKRLGPVYGALLGSIPQCGFSVIAADLFSKRAVTTGTLIAIFVATSDEAIPILLSHPDKSYLVAAVIGIKIIIAIACGVLIDLFYKNKEPKNVCHTEEHHDHFHGNCESCDDGILRSAIKHTIKIFAFVFVATFILTWLIDTVGEDMLASYMMKNSAFQPFVAALIGLVPNCAASVILTQTFLAGAISFGSLVAGLSSGAGVGILLLFRKNSNIKQSLGIITVLYFIGALSGVLLQLFSV